MQKEREVEKTKDYRAVSQIKHTKTLVWFIHPLILHVCMSLVLTCFLLHVHFVVTVSSVGAACGLVCCFGLGGY